MDGKRRNVERRLARYIRRQSEREGIVGVADGGCPCGIVPESPCGKHKQVDVPEEIGRGPDQAVAITAGIFEGRVVLKLEIGPLKEKGLNQCSERFSPGIEIQVIPVLPGRRAVAITDTIILAGAGRCLY